MSKEQSLTKMNGYVRKMLVSNARTARTAASSARAAGPAASQAGNARGPNEPHVPPPAPEPLPLPCLDRVIQNYRVEFSGPLAVTEWRGNISF